MMYVEKVETNKHVQLLIFQYTDPETPGITSLYNSQYEREIKILSNLK